MNNFYLVMNNFDIRPQMHDAYNKRAKEMKYDSKALLLLDISEELLYAFIRPRKSALCFCDLRFNYGVFLRNCFHNFNDIRY